MCRIVRSCGLRLFFTAAVYLATLQLKYRGVSPSEGRVGDHLGRVSYPEFVFLTTILAGERPPPSARVLPSPGQKYLREAWSESHGAATRIRVANVPRSHNIFLGHCKHHQSVQPSTLRESVNVALHWHCVCVCVCDTMRERERVNLK